MKWREIINTENLDRIIKAKRLDPGQLTHSNDFLSVSLNTTDTRTRSTSPSIHRSAGDACIPSGARLPYKG